MNDRKPVAVVAGAGPGNGAALARRFAKGGYAVALLARDAGKIADLAEQIDGAVVYACDVGDPASVKTTGRPTRSESAASGRAAARAPDSRSASVASGFAESGS